MASLLVDVGYVLVMERSSAYLVSLKSVFFSGELTSLKKTFQRHGPRTVPWNTMCVRLKGSECCPCTSTIARRVAR